MTLRVWRLSSFPVGFASLCFIADLVGGGALTLPENSFQNLKQLKIVRCHMQELEIQDGACPAGTLMEMSSCRQCETLVLGKNCFASGEMLRVTRVPNLYLIKLGENAFENASEWNISGICEALG